MRKETVSPPLDPKSPMDLIELRQADQLALATRFSQSFDRSRCETLMRDLYAGKTDVFPRAQSIGSGSHFHAYRLAKLGEMQLTVSVALPSFIKNELRCNQWVELMQRLKQLKLTLIPPFEILKGENQLAVVMPYAEAVGGMAAVHWQPLTKLTETLVADLAKHHLFIDDHIQIRCHEKIPFVIDLSDLVATR